MNLHPPPKKAVSAERLSQKAHDEILNVTEEQKQKNDEDRALISEAVSNNMFFEVS